MTGSHTQQTRDEMLALAKLGSWWAECCEQDLYEIDTEAELEGLLERLSPDEVEEIGLPMGVWATFADALADPWIDETDLPSRLRA